MSVYAHSTFFTASISLVFLDTPADISTPLSISFNSNQLDAIETAGDADWYAIDVVIGHEYVVDLMAVAGDFDPLGNPELTLYDGSGNRVAGDRDSGTGNDARLVFTATETATWYVGASGEADTTGSHSLEASETPLPGSDIPGDVGSTAYLTTLAKVTGTIDQFDDQDWYRFEVIQNQQYLFELKRDRDGVSPLRDPFLFLYDANGNPIDQDDDSGPGFNSQLNYTATEDGFVFVAAGSFAENLGDYRLFASLAGAVGTNGRDTLEGDGNGNTLLGFQGRDLLIGLGVRDTLDG
ncbi:MAG: PPC domain-containing protein, partial [Pseudomonadota bacterium]